MNKQFEYFSHEYNVKANFDKKRMISFLNNINSKKEQTITGSP